MSEMIPAAELSYEAARDELVATLGKLESGQVPLEQTLQLWERGEELAKRCQSILDAAMVRFEEATKTE